MTPAAFATQRPARATAAAAAPVSLTVTATTSAAVARGHSIALAARWTADSTRAAAQEIPFVWRTKTIAPVRFRAAQTRRPRAPCRAVRLAAQQDSVSPARHALLSLTPAAPAAALPARASREAPTDRRTR